MKKSDTMSLGEFRKLTKDLPDDSTILVIAPEGGSALAVQHYPFETSLNKQGAILLEMKLGESIRFSE